MFKVFCLLVIAFVIIEDNSVEAFIKRNRQSSRGSGSSSLTVYEIKEPSGCRGSSCGESRPMKSSYCKCRDDDDDCECSRPKPSCSCPKPRPCSCPSCGGYGGGAGGMNGGIDPATLTGLFSTIAGLANSGAGTGTGTSGTSTGTGTSGTSTGTGTSGTPNGTGTGTNTSGTNTTGTNTPGTNTNTTTPADNSLLNAINMAVSGQPGNNLTSTVNNTVGR